MEIPSVALDSRVWDKQKAFRLVATTKFSRKEIGKKSKFVACIISVATSARFQIVLLVFSADKDEHFNDKLSIFMTPTPLGCWGNLVDFALIIEINWDSPRV